MPAMQPGPVVAATHLAGPGGFGWGSGVSAKLTEFWTLLRQEEPLSRSPRVSRVLGLEAASCGRRARRAGESGGPADPISPLSSAPFTGPPEGLPRGLGGVRCP